MGSWMKGNIILIGGHAPFRELRFFFCPHLESACVTAENRSLNRIEWNWTELNWVLHYIDRERRWRGVGPLLAVWVCVRVRACLRRSGKAICGENGVWRIEYLIRHVYTLRTSSHHHCDLRHSKVAHTHTELAQTHTHTQRWIIWLSVSCLHEIGQANAPSQRERERRTHEELRFKHHGAERAAKGGGLHRRKCTADRVGERVATPWRFVLAVYSGRKSREVSPQCRWKISWEETS